MQTITRRRANIRSYTRQQFRVDSHVLDTQRGQCKPPIGNHGDYNADCPACR